MRQESVTAVPAAQPSAALYPWSLPPQGSLNKAQASGQLPARIGPGFSTSREHSHPSLNFTAAHVNSRIALPFAHPVNASGLRLHFRQLVVLPTCERLKLLPCMMIPGMQAFSRQMTFKANVFSRVKADYTGAPNDMARASTQPLQQPQASAPAPVGMPPQVIISTLMHSHFSSGHTADPSTPWVFTPGV